MAKKRHLFARTSKRWNFGWFFLLVWIQNQKQDSEIYEQEKASAIFLTCFQVCFLVSMYKTPKVWKRSRHHGSLVEDKSLISIWLDDISVFRFHYGTPLICRVPGAHGKTNNAHDKGFTVYHPWQRAHGKLRLAKPSLLWALFQAHGKDFAVC